MKTVHSILANTLTENSQLSGVITSLRQEAKLATLSIDRGESSLLVSIADGNRDELVIGDKVLCVSDGEGKFYIALLLEHGENQESDSSIQEVYNKKGELIFQYDQINNRAKVVVDHGDLDIEVPDGNLRFNAGGKVQIDGQQIELTTKNAAGVSTTSLNLKEFTANLRTRMLNVDSQHGILNIDNVNVVSEKLSSYVRFAKIKWHRVESKADSVLTKSRVQMNDIQELCQTQAGRMRTLVKQAFHLKAERTNIKADKTVNVDGERINIG